MDIHDKISIHLDQVFYANSWKFTQSGFLLNVEINQGITLVFGFTNGLRYAEYMKTYW